MSLTATGTFFLVELLFVLILMRPAPCIYTVVSTTISVVLGACDPPQVLNVVVSGVPIYMVYERLVFGIRYKCVSHKSVDIYLFAHNRNTQIPLAVLVTIRPMSGVLTALGQIHTPIFTD